MKKFKLANLKKLVPQSKVPKPNKPAVRLAARLTQPAYDDYDEEPTTKLSTAFVVVFVLHLVAIGGIYAFHNIKAKRREADGTAATANAHSPKEGAHKEAAPKGESAAKAVQGQTQSATGTGQPGTVAAASAAALVAGAAVVKAVPTTPVEKAPAGPSAVVPQSAKPATNGPAQAHSAAVQPAKGSTSGTAQAQAQAGDAQLKTYTVKKGDNPVQIAKRMGVNYDELLKINGVEDPKRLKIGQVLKLPVRTKPQSN